DDEQRERLVRRLRAELAALPDVDVATAQADGAAPEGTKSADPVTIGAIIVAMSASGGVFTALIETVKDWLGRQSDSHTITLTIGGDTIELSKATADERARLVDAFVQRHTKS
ncbi:hypothetical protein BJF78_33460, partial [Pseudonocardia sp. CNS-139]